MSGTGACVLQKPGSRFQAGGKMSENKLAIVVEKECCWFRPELSSKTVAHSTLKEKKRGSWHSDQTNDARGGKHGCSGPSVLLSGFRGYTWRQGGMGCDWARCISTGEYRPLACSDNLVLSTATWKQLNTKPPTLPLAVMSDVHQVCRVGLAPGGAVSKFNTLSSNLR